MSSCLHFHDCVAMFFCSKNVNLGHLLCLKAPNACRKHIYPVVSELKPAECAYRLASKPQEEVAQLVGPVRQAHVEEAEVLAALVVGFFYGIPYCHVGRPQQHVALSQKGCIPQIGVALADCVGAAAHCRAVVSGDEQSAAARLGHALEKYLVGNEPLQFQKIVCLQQMHEVVEIVVALYLCRTDAFLHGLFYSLQLLLPQPLLGRLAVQRVVYVHPVDMEEAERAQCLVTKHLGRRVAQLDVGHPCGQVLDQSGHHDTENGVARVIALVVASVAQYAAVPHEERRHPRRAAAHHSQQMAAHSAVSAPRYNHQRTVTRRFAIDVEQIGAMEEISGVKLWQFVSTGIYYGRYIVHCCKNNK